jgi:hypothetical protein
MRVSVGIRPAGSMATMPVLLLKLTLTPLLVGGASLAARRWGPAIGGWIVSLPLTSGPVLLFLALERGPQFATDASVGTLLGLAAIVAFSLAFAAASGRGPLAAIGAASVAYACAGLVLQLGAEWPFALLVGLVSAAILLAVRSLPRSTGARVAVRHPAWDLPARVVVGTGLVIGLTTVAPLLGPIASGILTTFPVYVTVLSAFAFHHEGRESAIDVLRGLLTGLVGTVAFYVGVHTLVVPAGIGPAFLVAVLGTMAVQVVALPRLRASAAATGVEPEAA